MHVVSQNVICCRLLVQDSESQTHIILTQMDALAPYGEGHIYSIVYQQGDFVSCRHLVKSLGRGNEDAGITGLVSVLYDGDTAPDRSVDDVTEVSTAKNGRRRVCHEIETVVGLQVCRCHDGQMGISVYIMLGSMNR